MKEDFEIKFDECGDDIVVTSAEEQINENSMKLIMSAFNDKDKIYYPYTKETDTSSKLTFDIIRNLVNGVQSDLSKLLQLNKIVRRFILSDDIIGKVYESLESNLNTDFKLSYARYDEHRNKKKKLQSAQSIIDKFNRGVGLRRIIRESIPLAYAEGNYIIYLRSVGDAYSIDYYPLGIAYVGDYTRGGKPVICINMDELKSRLNKIYAKDKKNKALFFKNIEDEIKNNYPPEVYEAYLAKERIAILDTERTGIIRVCNMGRKYGVSPITRALNAALMLENIEDADFINNKAKAKKIIHQVLRKEGMGTTFEKKGLADAAYAHSELMKAWNNKTVVYTSPPFVEKITYVEPSVQDTDSAKIGLYRSKIMTTLGIGFIDSDVSSFSVANISLEQLMKTINSISGQLEEIITDFYKVVLRDSGIEQEYLPDIDIVDAEQLSLSMKKDLVEVLYSKLNCSLESALSILGFSIEDEKQRRINENESGIDKVFFPRKTVYTAGANDTEGEGEGEAGRPADTENLEKQIYDKELNNTV